MNAALTAALIAVAAAPPYVPDLTRWRLELRSAPGGWVTGLRQQVEFRLVDPDDPSPPPEPGAGPDPYSDAEAWRPAPALTPAQERAERERREAEAKANAWRQRTVRVWLNGDPADAEYVSVNTTGTFWVESRNGENRLELLEPDSGARAGASWWASTTQDRLEVTPVQDGRWSWRHPWSLEPASGRPNGDLQVLEPDGALANYRTTPSGGRSSWSGYVHPAPPPGAYTVRWVPSAWAEPQVVTVEVVLDRGTDRERRWRFNRLILPGSPPATLGTFDVDP